MFHIGYCDHNRFNPDYDKIDRPEGSGDYLLLYLTTPMKMQLGTENIVTKEGALYSIHPEHHRFIRLSGGSKTVLSILHVMTTVFWKPMIFRSTALYIRRILTP